MIIKNEIGLFYKQFRYNKKYIIQKIQQKIDNTPKGPLKKYFKMQLLILKTKN